MCRKLMEPSLLPLITSVNDGYSISVPCGKTYKMAFNNVTQLPTPPYYAPLWIDVTMPAQCTDLDVNVVLPPGGLVTATVTNASPPNNPIANVGVNPSDLNNNRFVGCVTKADGIDKGKCTFVLPEGDFRISFYTANSEGYYLGEWYHDKTSWSVSDNFHVYPNQNNPIEEQLTPTNQISIDIKPGINPNLLKIDCETVLPVSILTTGNLNANKVDPSSITINGIYSTGSPIYQDVDNNGSLDLVLNFDAQSLGLTPYSSFQTLTITGALKDGTPITGTDSLFVYSDVISTIFDDFSLGTIDTSKWSFTTPIQSPPPMVLDGKLVIENSLANSTSSSKNSGLYFKNSAMINSYKAKVKILEFNNPDGAGATAELLGFFYNDTFPTPNYSSGVGNILAAVSIGYHNSYPIAYWYIARTDNATYTQFTTVASGSIPVNINIGEEYILFLGWSGSEFTFSVNGVEVRHQVTGNIYPPSYSAKYVRTQTAPPIGYSPPATYSTYIKASFDDIEIPAMTDYTPACTNETVQVQPFDTSTGQNPVTITYDQVTQSGVTTLSTSSTGPTPPSGFQMGDPPTYYEISTTAGFFGSINVSISYAGVQYSDEGALRLLHFENGYWVDCTTLS